jgi:PTH1 family peptidyl-tRNA hydrolase
MNWLIVGLGNPGKQYDSTPHNVGFAVVDSVRDAIGGSGWKLDRRSNALVSATDDSSVVLAKPQTFMNESGTAVRSLVKDEVETKLVVVYDDLALPLGTVRIGEFESSGGHRGIESILAHLGRTDFIRVRVGVLPPSGQPSPAEEFVTSKWQLKMDERPLVGEALQRATEATVALMSQPLATVQSKYSK